MHGTTRRLLEGREVLQDSCLPLLGFSCSAEATGCSGHRRHRAALTPPDSPFCAFTHSPQASLRFSLSNSTVPGSVRVLRSQR